MKFAQLGLGSDLLSAVEAAGYEDATPIQEAAIPVILAGRDVTGIAQTGTGKTAAFVLPMIDRLSRGRARARMPRSLILEPTRELAAQVAESFSRYGSHHRLDPVLLIGGVSFTEQDRKLMRGADVLIATPGRLLDQIERGKILLTGVQMLVIDEADRMMDMGFIPDIEKICALLPKRRQSLLFSATMPPEIARLAGKFQKDPEQIEVARPAATAATITQYVTSVSSGDEAERRAVLRGILRACTVQNAIVFCNRKREVDVVASSLRKHGFDAAAIHGDLPQVQRMETLEKFRNGHLHLLVASDVAARGLDIPDVSHVFNLAPPCNSNDYVHRIGRTGRAGRLGESHTILSPEDDKSWQEILRHVQPEVKSFSSDHVEREVKLVSRRRSGGASGRAVSSVRKRQDYKASSARVDSARKASSARVDSARKTSSALVDSVPVGKLDTHLPAFLTDPGSSRKKSPCS